jgi:hypothetical protein
MSAIKILNLKIKIVCLERIDHYLFFKLMFYHLKILKCNNLSIYHPRSYVFLF